MKRGVRVWVGIRVGKNSELQLLGLRLSADLGFGLRLFDGVYSENKRVRSYNSRNDSLTQSIT